MNGKIYNLVPEEAHSLNITKFDEMERILKEKFRFTSSPKFHRANLQHHMYHTPNPDNNIFRSLNFPINKNMIYKSPFAFEYFFEKTFAEWRKLDPIFPVIHDLDPVSPKNNVARCMFYYEPVVPKNTLCVAVRTNVEHTQGLELHIRGLMNQFIRYEEIGEVDIKYARRRKKKNLSSGRRLKKKKSRSKSKGGEVNEENVKSKHDETKKGIGNAFDTNNRNLDIQFFVINSEQHSPAHSKFVTELVDNINFNSIERSSNCRARLLYEPLNPRRSRPNVFGGFDSLDAVLQEILKMPYCQWLMFTSGDSYYNSAWLNTVAPMLRQSSFKVVQWDYISRRPRVGHEPNQVVRASLQPGFLDLGSAMIHISLFRNDSISAKVDRYANLYHIASSSLFMYDIVIFNHFLYNFLFSHV